MRPYGTVSPLFWIGSTGKKLRTDRDAQLIALYLMTNPHSHQTGIYHLPLLYLATETGVAMEEALKALRRLEEEAFCRYDQTTEWIWVCEMAAWQIGESLKDNDKRAIGVRTYLESLPRLPFEGAFRDRYSADFHLSAIPQQRGSLYPSKGLTLIRTEQSRNRAGAEGEAGSANAPLTKLQTAGAETEGDSPGGVRVNGKHPPSPKGSRLPEDFTLTPSRAHFASVLGIDPGKTFDHFRDYWRAATGKSATKADWDATWRNWCRRETPGKQAKGGADDGLPTLGA